MSRAASKTTSLSSRAASKTTSLSGRAASKTTSLSSRAASKTTSRSVRLFGLVLSAMLVVTVLLPVAASAAPLGVPGAAADAVVVLAAEEGGAPDGPQGPEPGDPNDTENPAAPADYEAPFLWAASVGLLALALLGTLTLVGLYYLLVVRPREKTSDRS